MNAVSEVGRETVVPSAREGSRDDFLNYLGSISAELGGLARRRNFEVLACLLGMVAEEVALEREAGRPRAGPKC